MLIYSKEAIYDIDDDRVYIVKKFDLRESLCTKAMVYIDGLLFAEALEVFIEHKQYKEFSTIVNPKLVEDTFGRGTDVVFYDVGVRDSSNGTDEFKDYSAKAKEGISYFEDILTPEDKECLYKENYVKSEVRL